MPWTNQSIRQVRLMEENEARTAHHLAEMISQFGGESLRKNPVHVAVSEHGQAAALLAGYKMCLRDHEEEEVS